MAREVEKRKQDVQTVRVNEQKWTKTLMDAGWTAFPSIIIEKQAALGLDPLDVNIILVLASYWWQPDNRPHPTKKTIAEIIGVGPRTVQKRIAKLEHVGFIRREYRPDKEKGNKSNVYHFDGLIKEVKPYALEKIQSIKSRQKEEEDRRKRRKPRLKTIPGGKSND